MKQNWNIYHKIDNSTFDFFRFKQNALKMIIIFNIFLPEVYVSYTKDINNSRTNRIKWISSRKTKIGRINFTIIFPEDSWPILYWGNTLKMLSTTDQRSQQIQNMIRMISIYEMQVYEKGSIIICGLLALLMHITYKMRLQWNAQIWTHFWIFYYELNFQ